MDHAPPTTDYHPGLHWWAVLTVCAALPLVLLGAEVTTRQVGMADEVGFRTPWHMATLWLEGELKPRGLGFVIEHSHRLAGFIVGGCTIVLSVWCFRSAPTRTLRWMGAAALVGVSIQGLLGGFRVNLHQMLGPDLALIHGCFGQMVFALLVSAALLSSRRWCEPIEQPATGESSPARRTAWFALLVTGLVLGQLIFGAILRHRGSPLGQRLHLMFAFAVVAGVLWLLRSTMDSSVRDRRWSGAAKLLAALVVVQIILGVEAWMTRFAGMGLTVSPEIIWRRDLVRSAHVLTGACILAASVVVTLEAFRRAVPASVRATELLGRLQGVA